MTTCDICVKSPGSDQTGAPKRDPYAVVAAGIPCLVNDTSGSVEQRNSRRSQIGNRMVYLDPGALPAGLAITAKHQLRVPNYGGRVLVVMNVVNPNEIGHHLEIDCEETVV